MPKLVLHLFFDKKWTIMFLTMLKLYVLSYVMQSEAQGLEVEKEARTLENNGHRQEWDGSPMMGPWMTS